MADPTNLYEYVGAIHIHTKDSDGTKTHEEIIRIADKIHLDFLIFTDHMTMIHKSLEGWHKRVMVLIGYEIQDSDDLNHYLAIGLNETLPEGMRPKQYVREVKQKGGIGIIAHPDEVREIKEVPAYPWKAWHVRGYQGIEVWNHMSSWLEGVNKGNWLKYLLHPRSFLTTPSEETLARWDREAEKRRVIGIGSLDVHAAEYKWGPLKFTVFPYKVQLQAIRTHVLLPKPLNPSDFDESRENFLKSLKQAQAFISNYRWGNARGFRFWCESPRQTSVMGGAMRHHPKIVFKVKCPEEGTINFIHKGEVLETRIGKEAEFNVKGDGAYRVEVLKDGKGWIYSNHIKILPSRRYSNRGRSNSRRRSHKKK